MIFTAITYCNPNVSNLVLVTVFIVKFDRDFQVIVKVSIVIYLVWLETMEPNSVHAALGKIITLIIKKCKSHIFKQRKQTL